jgi:hypothetical protein
MGGAGLPFGLILIGLFIVILLASVYVIVPWWRKEEAERKRITDPSHESLVYEVPEGRDPAAILAALHSDGLDAVEVMEHGRQRVVISAPSGKDQLRPRARAVIAHEADLNLEGDPARGRVMFADE